MDLADYFEKTDGCGILATCDPEIIVNQAIYSKPFVIDEKTVAFVMKQGVSHKNLNRLPKACYLFLEQGDGYKGVRIYLTLQREEQNQSLIEQLRKEQPSICAAEDDSSKYLVFFDVDHIRPLIGGKAIE